jgi:hypothetical protein
VSSTVHDIPSEVLALLPLPDPDTLSADQTRGALCVWGGEPLNTGTAVDLGERVEQGVRLFLRACPGCAVRAALRAIHKHAPLCEQCVDDSTQCPPGLGLLRLLREARSS